MRYRIRYFFDPGSGVCLWAQNAAAREAFDYTIDHWQLPLSANTKRWLQYLIAWIDTSLDWENPADPAGCWSHEERERFRVAAARGLLMLREELPAALYEVIDEH